jgi:hypothetical protein
VVNLNEEEVNRSDEEINLKYKVDPNLEDPQFEGEK